MRLSTVSTAAIARRSPALRKSLQPQPSRKRYERSAGFQGERAMSVTPTRTDNPVGPNALAEAAALPDVDSPRSDSARSGVWIVVPAYHEARRLGKTLSGLCRHYAQVVVVDDGSRDETSAVAAQHPVWVLRHVFNCGQGAALQTGIDFALRQGAAVVVTFDADGQHCVEDIPRLVRPLLAGEADVALGSRFLGKTEGLPWSRMCLLRGGVVFTRCFSGLNVTDTHNGLRAFSRQAAEAIRIRMRGMAHASELLDQIGQKGLRYCEVPVTIRYSEETLAKGQSSWNAVRIVGQLLLSRLSP